MSVRADASATRPVVLKDNFDENKDLWNALYGEWKINDSELRGHNGLISTKLPIEGDYLYMAVNMKTEKKGTATWEAGRIYARYKDLNDSMSVFLGGDNSIYLTIKKIGEKWKEWSEFVGISPDQWVKFGIELRNSTLSVCLNNEIVLQVTDEWIRDYSGAKIAFEAFGQSDVCFDDFICYNLDAKNEASTNMRKDVTCLLAEWSIDNAHAYYNGYYYYHYLPEFSLDGAMNDEWYIMWMDDMFYLMTGRYDCDFLAKALDTYAMATMKTNSTHTSPRIHVVKMDTQMIDTRAYGALYFNIMVYQYVKSVAETVGGKQALSRAMAWKEAVLKNYNYIKNNFIRDGLFYTSDARSELQPDYVRKGGYVTDMTIYYLCSLKTLDLIYGIDTVEEFKKVQQALIDTLWDEKLGFFIDWIDTNGSKHVHYGTEQLWGIVFDVLPDHQQEKMFSSLLKSREACGRFWQYQRYREDELASQKDMSWDDRCKISQAMLYVQTLRKFNYDETKIQSLIEPFQEAIIEYGHFPDTYTWDDQEKKLVRNGFNNFIMNSGSWLAIVKDVDLTFTPIANASSALDADVQDYIESKIQRAINDVNEKLLEEISGIEANSSYYRSLINSLNADVNTLHEEFMQLREEQIHTYDILERFFYTLLGAFIVLTVFVILRERTKRIRSIEPR